MITKDKQYEEVRVSRWGRWLNVGGGLYGYGVNEESAAHCSDFKYRSSISVSLGEKRSKADESWRFALIQKSRLPVFSPSAVPRRVLIKELYDDITHWLWSVGVQAKAQSNPAGEGDGRETAVATLFPLETIFSQTGQALPQRWHQTPPSWFFTVIAVGSVLRMWSLFFFCLAQYLKTKLRTVL